MKKFISIIEKITTLLSGDIPGWTIFLLMVMVLAEVVARYVLNSPLSIADEFGGYMLVGVTFVGLAYTWKEGGHISVEFVTNLLPAKIRLWLRFVTLLMVTVFCWPLIYSSYDLLEGTLLFGARSGSWLRTPLVYPQSLLLIGSVLLLVQLIAENIKTIQALRHLREEKKHES